MNKSVWKSARMPRFPKLRRSERFDVVVVGAGITGLSAAYFLKQAGKRVAVVERDRIGSGETGRTTAHLTAVTDLRLAQLVKNLGEERARAVWDAGALAIDSIESIAATHDIECDFQRVPGFLHAALQGTKDETRQFVKEAELGGRLGLPVEFVESAPIVHKPGLRFADQAKFQPLNYLAGLARIVASEGSEIFEHTEVTEVSADPLVVRCGDQRLACDYLVIATHVPLVGKTGMASATLLQTKLASFSSYAIGAKLPRGTAPQVSLWDTSHPYFYLRVDRTRSGEYVIFGGEDHKTGQTTETGECFERLESVLHEVLPRAKVDRRWSGQVVETNDGLPFIGESAERQFVATGFAGNGMTFGTFAGMMARDAMLGRENPWQELFAVGRTKLRGGAWKYLKENVDFPYYFAKDHLFPAEGRATREVKRGEGKILKLNGERVACSRDEQGKATLVSAVCTHMGCLVRWNGAEKTWDCPCHGSRFTPGGEVIAGPAETPLKPVKTSLKESAAAKTNGRVKKQPNGRNKIRPRRDSASPGKGR